MKYTKGKIDETNIDVEKLNGNAANEQKLRKLLEAIKDKSAEDISIREYLLKMGVTDEYLDQSILMTKDAGETFLKFAKEFGIQAVACSVGSDSTVQLIINVFLESSQIAGKIAAMEGNISNAQMELFMTANRLHEFLMDRKLGKFGKPTVTSNAVEKMFQMWEMFPASMQGMLGMLP